MGKDDIRAHLCLSVVCEGIMSCGTRSNRIYCPWSDQIEFYVNSLVSL